MRNRGILNPPGSVWSLWWRQHHCTRSTTAFISQGNSRPCWVNDWRHVSRPSVCRSTTHIFFTTITHYSHYLIINVHRQYYKLSHDGLWTKSGKQCCTCLLLYWTCFTELGTKQTHSCANFNMSKCRKVALSSYWSYWQWTALFLFTINQTSRFN